MASFFVYKRRGVGEYLYRNEGYDVSRTGAMRSKNVGMSNRKSDEMSDHRKPKVSLAMNINQGLGGPKTTPKGLVDGQPVNIPALPHFFDKMTEFSSPDVLLDSHLCIEIRQGMQKVLVTARAIGMSKLPRKVFES